MKCILLIKQGLGIGGTETLTFRMSNWFVQHGIEVFLLTENREDKTEDHLNSRVKKIIYQYSFYSLLKKNNASALVKEYKLEKVDVIYGYGPIEFAVSVSLNRVIGTTKILIGVYHPQEFNIPHKKYCLGIIAKKILKIFPKKNILFMNEDTLKSHECILQTSFQGAKIWPLPLNIPEFRDINDRSNIIISVGNLKEFKTYNLTMIDVIFNLLKKGYDVRYEIYGEGPLREEMEYKIIKLKLQNHIFLKGQTNYENYCQTVRRGFVFIGIGTAVLEAASFGVPSITTVAFVKEPISFGYVHNLSGYNVGEPIENYKYKSIEKLIENLIVTDKNAYNNIQRKGYDFVNKHYQINKLMYAFIELTEEALPWEYNKIDRILLFAYLASLLDRIKMWAKSILKTVLKKNKRK